MNREIRSTIAAALLIAPIVVTPGGAAQNLLLQPESRLWVSGTSTVRSYECTAKAVEAEVASADAAAADAVLSGQKAITAVTVTIPSARMDCGNGTMNEHMLKALKADAHPEIEFTVESYELAPGAEGTTARLNGTLHLGGVPRPVSIDAAVSDGGDGGLRVAGSHELLMSDYELRAPRLMLGTLKVHDRVTVHFDLNLKG